MASNRSSSTSSPYIIKVVLIISLFNLSELEPFYTANLKMQWECQILLMIDLSECDYPFAFIVTACSALYITHNNKIISFDGITKYIDLWRRSVEFDYYSSFACVVVGFFIQKKIRVVNDKTNLLAVYSECFFLFFVLLWPLAAGI